MNHDFDDELGKNTERRSRRNPKMRTAADNAGDLTQGGTVGNGRQEKEIWESRQRAAAEQAEKALDIMGDATVHPLKRTAKPVTAAESADGNTRQGVEKRQSGSRGNAGKSSAALQSGATSEGPGIRQQLEAQAAKRKRRRRIITMIIAECIALVFIFGYAYVARLTNMIQRPENFNIEDVPTNEIDMVARENMKGYWTIAVFGVDARDNAITKGTNADVNIICNINRDTGEIKLVSVFRDTYLNISEGGSYNKLNQAYFVGGPEQAIQTLNRNLDLQINDYMTFNWKAVADAINVLGGVDIELSKAEFYYINGFITETVKATGVGSKHLTHAGMNHLDGVQAVAYGRLRLMDTDYARTERQRKVIAQAFEKAKKADFKTLNVLIGTVFPQVSTSIWVDDLVSNAKNISKFHLGETTGFPQARGNVRMGKKGDVVVPQTLESNVIKLHEFLFGDADYVPSQTVKNISAKIAADTGMYKEGQYVESVSTEGGVIQQPKATKPAATDTDEDDEDDIRESHFGSRGEIETDEDGNPIEVETDEDGNPVEIETDEDGNPIQNPSVGVKPGLRPTAAGIDEDGNPIERETDEDGNLIESDTDEDGNPLETESTSSLRPGYTQESTAATRPTSANSSGTTRPGSTANDNTTTRPGATSEIPGSNTGSSSTGGNTSSGGTGVTTAPGSSSSGGTGTTTVPGGSSTNSTGTGVTTAPGSSSSGGTTTAPGSGSTSGSGTGVTTAPGSSSSGTSSAPGSSSATVPTAAQTTNSGPGSTGSQSGSSAVGTVAAPGQ